MVLIHMCELAPTHRRTKRAEPYGQDANRILHVDDWLACGSFADAARYVSIVIRVLERRRALDSVDGVESWYVL